jgi:hypothetical protein
MMRREQSRGGIIAKEVRLAAASWIILAGVTACTTAHLGQRPSPTEVTANPPAQTPDVPPETPPPVVSPPPPVQGTADPRVSATAAMPPCVPAPSKTSRAHELKAKEVPQGPATAGPGPAPGAVVDAQVEQVDTPLTSILGKNVHGPTGEDLGRVVDVLADANGHMRVAIIDFGGFLGVGTRRIAVDWPLLRFDPNARDNSLILSVTREKLQSAPTYKDTKNPPVLMPPSIATPDHAADTGQTTK